MPEIKTLIMTTAGVDVEQQELSFIAGRNAKRYSHFGNILAIFYIFYKTKIHLYKTQQLRTVGIEYLPKKNWKHIQTKPQWVLTAACFISAKT